MSSVPAVKAALVALWTTALAPDVVTGYGNRVTLSPSERLTVGSARGTTEPITLGPTRQMEENYELACLLSVTQDGPVDIQQQVTERAFVLFGLAEVALRSVGSENAGVTGVLLAYVAGDFELTEAPAADTGGKINSTIAFTVRVQARYRLTLP